MKCIDNLNASGEQCFALACYIFSYVLKPPSIFLLYILLFGNIERAIDQVSVVIIILVKS